MGEDPQSLESHGFPQISQLVLHSTKPSDLVKIRRFFFTFCLKKFSEKLCGFAKFAVDPNRDPYGSKNRPGGGISTSGLPVFSLASEGICQNFSHGFRRLLLGRCRDVGVGVQGETGLGVAQDAGEGLGIYAAGQSVGGEGVP